MVEADKDPSDGDCNLSSSLFIYNTIEKLRTRAQANYNEVILSAILESKIKMVRVGGLPYHGNGRMGFIWESPPPPEYGCIQPSSTPVVDFLACHIQRTFTVIELTQTDAL